MFLINKMFFLNIIFCALVLCYIEQVNSLKVCNDCVVFTSCPNAMNLATYHKNEATKTKFVESFCGLHKSYIKDISLVKVCCSDFTISNRYSEPSSSTDAIETHPNLNLLPESCGDIDGHRIVGGSVAKLYEFPWMALISYRTKIGYSFDCGGSIINSRYILTAGHCVTSNLQIAGVRIGEYNIFEKNDCTGEGSLKVCESHIQDILVENIIRHPNYTTLPHPKNDIALLRLRNPINLTYKNALPICLPLTQKLRDVQLNDQIATVAGWGMTKVDNMSPVLLKVNITVKTGEECRIWSKRRDNERISTEFCAGDLDKDSCRGDSGGPLILEGTYNGAERYIQYGIVSNGPVMCGSESPGMYTDVSKFMDWILDNIKE